jgi:hypothetical protein
LTSASEPTSAPRGETDPVKATTGVSRRGANGVDAALALAMSENLVPYTEDIGTILSGSTETFIR